MISVLIAHDYILLLDGLRALLEAQSDLKVVGRATDGNEAVRVAKQLRADVAILDISMPGLNGIDATRQILELSHRRGS